MRNVIAARLIFMRHFVLHILGITGFCENVRVSVKTFFFNIVEKHVFIPFTNKKAPFGRFMKVWR